MPAPETIQKLVSRFCDRIVEHRSNKHKEAEIRRDFIDPLFEALGWDMANNAGFVEQYREVICEDAIKTGSTTKAPDYCFTRGGEKAFFVETTKPSDDSPKKMRRAFGLRCYAWTSKHPLAVFTDFEEFAVYDCRRRPFLTDKASQARIFFLRFDEYLSRWDEIERLFSKKAVLRGSIDRYVKAKGVKRGHVKADDEFLSEIETWRELLAKNIALPSAKLDNQQINFALQRVIDRIIFLRICEDRGIEEPGRLRALQEGENNYKRMIPILQEAGRKYNLGLFCFSEEKKKTTEPDGISLGLDIDDKVIKSILQSICLEGCPYVFSVFPSDILGQVYERFLGKAILKTAKLGVQVKDRPQVKKTGGVFYTPSYIVDYIVKNTIGNLVYKKTPQQVARLKICDPACGGGSFLLGAYRFLLDWHLDYYEKQGDPKNEGLIFKGKGGRWRLVTQERKRILNNNIYGVDIDSQAVEVTKNSLVLESLEGENEDTSVCQMSQFHERDFFDLGENIKCGNSLIDEDIFNHISTEYLTKKNIEQINVFSWENEFPFVFKKPKPGFDAVIGNPPYDVLEKDRKKASRPHTVLGDYVKKKRDYEAALGGKLNLYRFFLVRSIQLTCKNGRFGMIVPLSLLADTNCRNARKHLLGETHCLRADCFLQKDNPERRVFQNAKISTVVITATKRERSLKGASITVATYPGNSFNEKYKQCEVSYLDSRLLDPKNCPIPLLDEDTWSLVKKIYNTPGVQRLGACSSDVIVHRGEINQTIYRDYIEDNPRQKRLVKGVEIGRYVQHVHLSQGKKKWFNELRFLEKNTPRPIAKQRRIALQRITGVDEKLRLVATIIEPEAYFADSTNSINMASRSRYKLEYVLGVLNSKMMQWRFKHTSTNNNVGTNEINSLPFRQINFDNESDRARHDEIVNQVKRIIELYKSLETNDSPHLLRIDKQRIGECFNTIDDRVFELYGLSSDERRVIKKTEDY